MFFLLYEHFKISKAKLNCYALNGASLIKKSKIVTFTSHPHILGRLWWDFVSRRKSKIMLKQSTNNGSICANNKQIPTVFLFTLFGFLSDAM